VISLAMVLNLSGLITLRAAPACMTGATSGEAKLRRVIHRKRT
jgi:hypothetical protein